MLFYLLKRVFVSRAANNSVEDTGGACAMVGAILAGSSSDKLTGCVTVLVSTSLLWRILAISIGIYPKLFSSFTILAFHALVHWLYFLVTICLSPLLLLACPRLTWKFQLIASSCLRALYALNIQVNGYNPV